MILWYIISEKKKKIHNETIYYVRIQSLIIKIQYAPSIGLVPKSTVTDTQLHTLSLENVLDMTVE